MYLLYMNVAILVILFKKYFKEEKIWWHFVQLYKNSTDCFVSKFWQSTPWVDFKIEFALSKARRKKIKFYILTKKWEQLPLTLNNSKSEERRDDYLDNNQICSRQGEFEILNVIFYRFCSEGTSEFDFWKVFKRVGMEFNFLSIQVIKSQLSLWISKFFSSNLSNILHK